MISVTLPIILPLLFAIISGISRSDHWRTTITVTGSALHTIVSAFLLWSCLQGEIQVAVIGDWLPPYGIVLVSDLFSSLFLFTISLIFLATNLYGTAEAGTKTNPLRIPLIFILQSGISLSLLTGDFFNLFVSFEMMLVASYALVALELSEKNLKWAFSYLLINLIGTLGFLCAAAMIYGYTGHLNMAALSELFKDQNSNPLVLGWGYLLLGIFGLKAAIFPLYFWLPRTYSHLPASLAALFAGSLTKVGIYVLIRMFVVILPAPLGNLNNILLVLSTFTMILGVLGAVSCTTIRGILSYHIISQIGYMILGLSLYTPLAIASVLLFIIHNIWVKVSLFLIGGVTEQASETDDLKKMGNLSLAMPWLAASFLIQAFSLAGLPPLSGFWGKYLLVMETIRMENYFTAVVALLTSWLTLFSMVKIWIGAFWKNSPNEKSSIKKITLTENYISVGMLVVANLMLGLCIEPIYNTTVLASEQIFQKEPYIVAIFKASGKGLP
jgi:multicomponent Na+:H+ antiporter subunit D